MSTSTEIAPEVRERLKAQNPRIILNTLLDGGEWHHDDRIFVLSDNYELCVVAWALDTKNGIDWENKEDGERRYLKTDISLSAFIKMAFDTSLDETAIMAANSTLNSLRTKRT